MGVRMKPTKLSKAEGGVVKSKLKPRLSAQPCPKYGKKGALPEKMTKATVPRVKGVNKGSRQ